MAVSSANADPTAYEVVTAYQKQYPDPIVAPEGVLVTRGERDRWGDHGMWMRSLNKVISSPLVHRIIAVHML